MYLVNSHMERQKENKGTRWEAKMYGAVCMLLESALENISVKEKQTNWPSCSNTGSLLRVWYPTLVIHLPHSPGVISLIRTGDV